MGLFSKANAVVLRYATHFILIKRAQKNASFSGIGVYVLAHLQVSVGNPREFIQAEKQEQEIAEGCKRLLKNCIICWNYLYLSQRLADTDDPEAREAFLQAVASGSVVTWRHINLLGEYDFSDEKLRDSVGIRPPKLAG